MDPDGVSKNTKLQVDAESPPEESLPLIWKLLVIGAGGFVGATARYLATDAVKRSFKAPFPVETFAVNIAGCLILGALMAFVELRQGFSESTRLFLSIGILGSFTTFSTFGNEGMDLIRTGQVRVALFYLVGSVTVGLLAVLAGRQTVRYLVA